jgi:glycosyltransferase involved in cell wall biosynthesis
MNILVLTREFPPHVVGGLSYHLAHLYSDLADRGHTITVVTGVASDSDHAAAHLVHSDISVHRVRYGRFTAHHLKFPLVLWRFLRGFDTSPYDVAVTHTPLPFGLSIPLVGKYHDCPQAERQYFRREMGPLVRLADTAINPTRRLVARRSLTAVDDLIFNSRLCRNAWQRHFDCPSSHVVYNGVNTELFSPTETGSTDEYVLFVGDSQRKGVSQIRQYARRGEYPVYVVGNLSDPPPNVRLFDRQPPHALADLYAGAEATVHPAQFEAFGNTVLESLACGTPVVTTSDCGASELLTDAVGAVDTTLADGIAHCRQLRATDCRERACEFTWEAVGERTIAILSRHARSDGN